MTPTIMAAPTGARRGKADHPNLPIAIEEIAAEAAACQAAGADAIHLHVRDAAGRHSLDAGLYREVIAATNAAAPGLPIQITTEAAGIYAPAEQLACLEAVRPADASVCVREIAPDPLVADRLYHFAAEAGISIQHILFTDEDVATLRAAYASGRVPETMHRAILVLGAYAPARNGDPAELPARLKAIEDMNLDWAVCAFGGGEQACLEAAMRLGGHARVGFENNLHRPDGALADSTAEQVARLVQVRARLTEKD